MASFSQKLDPHKHLATTKENISAILRRYGISEFTFAPINEGIANTSLVVVSPRGKYVLRVYSQERSDPEIKVEIEFQDHLRDKGIPIPKLYKNDEGSEATFIEISGVRWRCILMDFVEGRSVTTTPSKALLRELAEIQAKMHLIGVEFANGRSEEQVKWNDLRDFFAKHIDDMSKFNSEELALIQRIKEYAQPLDPKLPYGYNHLDIDFDGNVITDGDRVSGIVDFDDVQYSPVVACLGYTLYDIYDNQGEAAMRYYLEEYEKLRPLSDLEKATLPYILFFRNYVLGSLPLYLWDGKGERPDISRILVLEKEIPRLTFE